MKTIDLKNKLENPREGYLSKVNYGKPATPMFKLAYFESQEQDLREAAAALSVSIGHSESQLEIVDGRKLHRYNVIITTALFNQPLVINEVLIAPVCLRELRRMNGREIWLAFLFYDHTVPTDVVTLFEPQHTIAVDGLFTLKFSLDTLVAEL